MIRDKKYINRVTKERDRYKRKHKESQEGNSLLMLEITKLRAKLSVYEQHGADFNCENGAVITKHPRKTLFEWLHSKLVN